MLLRKKYQIVQKIEPSRKTASEWQAKHWTGAKGKVKESWKQGLCKEWLTNLPLKEKCLNSFHLNELKGALKEAKRRDAYCSIDWMMGNCFIG